MTRVLIIGAGGMLGHELTRACAGRELPWSGIGGRSTLDVTDRAAVDRTLDALDVDVVVNATGYTDVDGAEFEPEHAFGVNHDGVANLAAACRRRDMTLVHFSSDYIFPGDVDGPISVHHPTGPRSVYGRSKLAGENAIRRVGLRHLIVRTSWLFAPHGRNFVRTILNLAGHRSSLPVVTDQVGRPTSCRDLAETTFSLIAAGVEGTYHLANDGTCSWHEFAGEIVRQAGLSCSITPCRTSDFPRPAARPRNSVLDLSETAAIIDLPQHWRDALGDCLEQIRTEASVSS